MLEEIKQLLKDKKYWFEKYQNAEISRINTEVRYERLQNTMAELSGKYIALKAKLNH